MNPSNLPTYTYKPLGENEFRLLVLRKGKEKDVVHVQIEHANIVHEQRYAALSYVWGDAENNLQPVIIDRKYVHWATYNLWQALRRIRVDYEDRVLWVDAICIDQYGDRHEENDEKSQQLQLMPRIYPQASRVLCWLGDDDDNTAAEAFAILTRWALAYDDEPRRSELALDARRCLVHLQPDESTPLGRLFDRPYFSRAWCLQEVCVDIAKPPIALCGQHEISWNKLYFGFLTMASSLYEAEVLRTVGPSISNVIPILSISWTPSKQMLLSNLLPLMAKRQAMIPKDKIFSLLGLVQRSGLRYPPPNYAWTMDEVCIIYTRAAIETEQSLGMLRVICAAREGDKLPSWCIKPDQWNTVGEGNLELFSPALFEKYSASRGMGPLLGFPSGSLDRVLRMQGFRHDSIAEVHDLSQFLDRISSKPQAWSDILESACTFCRDKNLPSRYHATGETMTQAFLRALSCDDFCFHSGREKDSFRRDLFYDAYKDYVCGVSTDVSLSAPRTGIDLDQILDYTAYHFAFREPSQGEELVEKQYDLDVPFSFLEERVIQELLTIIRERIGSRKFVVTRRGHIGFARASCLAKDEICIVPGSAVPLVFREVKADGRYRGHHRFIGDAYVHGIMYGESLGDSSEVPPTPSRDISHDNMTMFCIV